MQVTPTSLVGYTIKIGGSHDKRLVKPTAPHDGNVLAYLYQLVLNLGIGLGTWWSCQLSEAQSPIGNCEILNLHFLGPVDKLEPQHVGARTTHLGRVPWDHFLSDSNSQVEFQLSRLEPRPILTTPPPPPISSSITVKSVWAIWPFLTFKERSSVLIS